MRAERIAKVNAKKQNKRTIRTRRIFFFILVFCLYTGLTVVDYAGSEMTGYPPNLSLQARRVNSQNLEIRFLGKETLVNTESVMEKVATAKQVAEKTMSAISASIKSAGKSTDIESKIEDIQVLLPGKVL